MTTAVLGVIDVCDKKTRAPSPPPEIAMNSRVEVFGERRGYAVVATGCRHVGLSIMPMACTKMLPGIFSRGRVCTTYMSSSSYFCYHVPC